MVPAFMVLCFLTILDARGGARHLHYRSITDWYDGKIARATGTVTVIGLFWILSWTKC